MRPGRARLAAVLLAGALLGCTGADELGGADRLPGPVPEDAAYAEAPEHAVPAPPFELTLLDGTTVEAAALWEDRPVLLHFFAPGCERCKDQQPEISEVARELGDRVVFLGIGGDDDPEAVRDHLREHDVPYAVGLDPDQEVWRRYGVQEPPLAAVISRGGSLVRGAPGGVDGQRLRELLDEVLAEG